MTLATGTVIVLDDRVLIEELLVGLRHNAPHVALHTTTYWYYRACRAATAGAGGRLSGPFRSLAKPEQDRAILSLLELRDDIGLPDPRATVPVMADVATRYPRLNLLNLEVIAVAQLLAATIWLSERGAEGVLPGVLDREGIAWTTITVG